ncbi:MAG: hypothetical protein QM737_23610 [Ferruginibacter sp.]
MKTLLSLFLFLQFFFIPGYSHAQIQFIENKGQWNNEVKFKQDLSSGAFFLTGKGFTVLQYNTDDLKEISAYTEGMLPVKAGDDQKKMTLHSHAYKMSFVNALVPTILPTKMLSSYNNYFIGNDPSKWAGDCKMYEVVVYKNIYPGIDVSYYANNGQLKYDLIIHPGADVSKIEMKYEGVDALKIVKDELVIQTSVAEVKEMAPYAYEEGSNNPVDCKFKIEGNTVRFAIGNYNMQQTLIIDPILVFSTLTGSMADSWGHTATYGPDGSAYAAGVVFENGYPVSIGAFQTVFQGGVFEDAFTGFDIGVIRFNASGTNRIYATYLGGSSNESPMSLVSDATGNLIIAARTNSVNYPATFPPFGPCGNYDLAITKLNAAGTALMGSRVMGGTAQDGLNIKLKFTGGGTQSLTRDYGDDTRTTVVLDASGNIVISSQTQSNNFPVTTGAFQTVFGGGLQDGVIIKMSPDISNILFSSFIGGNGNDAAFDVAIDSANNNLFIAGSTESGNLPGDKTGVLQPILQGNTDGFISIVSGNGTSIIKTTYLGTAGFDMLYKIQLDTSGFPYVTGTTNGIWPVINASFSQTLGKQFIAKLQPTLSAYMYSTVFGTNNSAPNISPTAFLVDACENVYVSGWGGTLSASVGYTNSGTNGLLTTAGAIKATTDGKDFYMFVMEKNAASVLYASFFGADGGLGEHVDGGTSSFDKNGVLYQAVCNCDDGSVPFPTTPGAWSSTNGSLNCNQAVFKIAFDLCSVIVPLRLVYFKGYVSNTFHKLQWQVENEEAGDKYMIEKRTDLNEPFTDVYTTSTNTGRASHTYYAQLPAGNFPETFYRLKTISLSGRIAYSPVVRLSGNSNNDVIVKIARDNLDVYLPGEVQGIALFSADGKLLKQEKATSDFVSIPLNNIAHGILILKIQLKGGAIVKKIYY